MGGGACREGAAPGAGSLRVGGAGVAPSLGAREVASASASLRGGGVNGKVQPAVCVRGQR